LDQKIFDRVKKLERLHPAKFLAWFSEETYAVKQMLGFVTLCDSQRPNGYCFEK
jgi:hypothetical protein